LALSLWATAFLTSFKRSKTACHFGPQARYRAYMSGHSDIPSVICHEEGTTV
jgi:hypothetical protein